MTQKRTNGHERGVKRIALALLTVAGACAYGDSIFSDNAKDGDLANAANWSGGMKPDASTTVVLRPDWSGSQSRTEYILSDDVAYGKFDVSHFKAPAVLDLCRHVFSAAAFGTWSNPDPFSFTNGTLALSGNFVVDADSAARIGPGATVTMPASIEKTGIKLNANARLIVDGGTFNVPSISGGYSLGNQFGEWNKANTTLEVRNGGTFRSPNAGRNQVTIFQSKLLVTDSTFDLSNGNNTDYAFMTGNGRCQVAVTNSTFKFKLWQVGGSSQCGLGCWNGNFAFVGSTVGGGAVSGGVAPSDMTFFHSPSDGVPARDNRFLFVDCDTAVNFKFGGVTNRVCLVGGTKVGQVILDGTANGLYVTNASVGATEDRFQIKGTDSVVEFSGPQAVLSKINGNNKATFPSGSNLALRLADGAKAYVGYYGNAEMMSLADGVDGLTIGVDDATLTTEGYLDLTAKGAKNVVFEMRGAAPEWYLKYWQTCRRPLLTVGRKEGLSAEVAPRIRFVLPPTPYSAAPIHTVDCPWFSVMLTSTAKLEFDFSQCGESNRRRTYPLIKGASMAHDRPDGSLTPIDAERLAELTANANLPGNCRLVYDSSTYTLSLVKNADAGMILIIR